MTMLVAKSAVEFFHSAGRCQRAPQVSATKTLDVNKNECLFMMFMTDIMLIHEVTKVPRLTQEFFFYRCTWKHKYIVKRTRKA